MSRTRSHRIAGIRAGMVAALYAFTALMPSSLAAADPIEPASSAAAGATVEASPSTRPTAEPSPTAPAPSTTATAEPSPTESPAPEPSPEPPAPAPAPSTEATAPIRYIVSFSRGATVQQREAALSAAGAISVSTVPALGLAVVELPPRNASLLALRASAGVARVELDRDRAAEAIGTDPRYVDQWSLPVIGWPSVIVPASGEAVVAILDTGIDASHPDLLGRLVPGASFVGTDPLTDPNGHGTWMAGIVAATTGNGEGIAGIGSAGVSVMPVGVLGADGTGQDSDIIAGIVFATDNGADVILLAFSAAGYSAALQSAIDYAWDRGAVIVAATGNDGVSTPTYPAGDRRVMGVSSTDRRDRLAASSNVGPTTFLGAPGTDILTTSPGATYRSISGTSASAAEVAASAAVLKAIDPIASNAVIVGRLARSAALVGTRDETGNGRLDLARAAADTGTDAVTPAGIAGAADGGPFVGPYVAASAVSDCFRTVASGDGSATAMWQTAPIAGGCVTWTAATLTPTLAANTITIRNGHTLTLGATGSFDQFVIDVGGQVTVNTGVVATMANGTATDLTVNGTVVVNGTIVASTDATMVVSGTLTINSGATLTGITTASLTINVGGIATNAGTFNGGNTLTVNGTLTSSTSITLLATANLQVGGTLTMTGGTLTTPRGTAGSVGSINSGGSIVLTGSSIWSIGTVAGATATVASGGTLDIGPSAIVSGAGFLTVASGATLKLGSTAGIDATMTTGNVQTTSATADSYSSTANYEYKGTAAQITGASLPATVNNLTINNSGPAIVTLTNAATTVSGALTLTSGDLSTGVGANLLTLAAAATCNGTTDVISGAAATGGVNRTTIVVGTTYCFGGPQNQITIASGTAPTAITVKLVKAAPAAKTGAVTRTYTITPTGGSGFAATVRLNYLDPELNGNTESLLHLWRLSGTWSDQDVSAASTTRDTTANWVQQTGIAAFSDWTLANGPDYGIFTATADVGSGAAGPTSSTHASGTYTEVGNGADIWGSSDQFHYLYKSWTGDGTIVARVTGLVWTAQNAKAGLMFRESTAAGSAHAYMNVMPVAGQGAELQYRATTGGSAGVAGAAAGIGPTYWVKLVRTGNTFMGFIAPDSAGSPGMWTMQGTQTVSMASTILVGLATLSHDGSVTTTATYDNVNIVSGHADFGMPDEAAALIQSSTSVALAWTESGTVTNRSLQRWKGNPSSAGSCGSTSWSTDGAAVSTVSPVTQTALVTATCYRWVQTLNTTLAITSGSVLIDTTAAIAPSVVATNTASVYQATPNGVTYFRPAAASTLTLTATGVDAEGGIGKQAYGLPTVATGWTPTYLQSSTDAASATWSFTSSGASTTVPVRAINNAVGIGFTTKVPSVTTSIANLTNAVAVSPDGQFAVFGSPVTPFVQAFRWTGTGFGQRLPDPVTLPAGQVWDVEFSPNGAYLALANEGAMNVTVYNWSSAGFGTKVADPLSTLGGNATGVAWSPTGDRIALIGPNSPYLAAWPFTTVFGTRFGNPGPLPAGVLSGVAFSPDGTQVATVGSSTPFLEAWNVTTAFGTKLANPSPPPGASNDLAFSADGRAVAVAGAVTPFIHAYNWSTAGFGAKFTNPAALAGIGNAVAFDPLSQYIAVAHATTPFVSVFPWTPGGFGTKLTDPATPGGTAATGVAISPRGAVIVATDSGTTASVVGYQEGAPSAATTLTITADSTAPAISAFTPGSNATQSSMSVTPTWTESDAASGVGSRSLQRQSGAPVAASCATTSWANDGAPANVASGVVQTGLTDFCYRWTLTLTDRVGNTSGVSTSSWILVAGADWIAPTPTFTTPALAPFVMEQIATTLSVAWTEFDAASGVASRSLQRQTKTPTTPSTCAGGTYANDGSASTGSSPSAETGLTTGKCYRWVLTMTDVAGNTATRTSSQRAVIDLGSFTNAQDVGHIGFSTKATSPIAAPAGTVTGLTHSPRGDRVLVGNGTGAPYVAIYPWDGFTHGSGKLVDPATLPGSQVNEIAFSPDGNYVAFALAATPFIEVYNWTGTTLGAKVADPGSLPAFTGVGGRGVAWSPDGGYILVGGAGGALVYGYGWAGTGFGAQIVGPAAAPAGSVFGLAFSPDGAAVAMAVGSSPYVNTYAWSAGFGAKATAPATAPTGVAAAVAWSPNGLWLAVAHATSPYVTVYPWSAGAYGAKVADPTLLPEGDATDVAFEATGDFIGVTYIVSPYVRLWEWTGGFKTAVGPLTANPLTVNPAGPAQRLSFDPAGSVAVGHATTPFFSTYTTQPGGTTLSAGTYTVKGLGRDIYREIDGFQFAYRTMTGDGRLTARVVTVQNTNANAKAGVMFRDTLTADSKHAMTAVEPSQTEFAFRSTTGGTTSNFAVAPTAPYWVRMTRIGDTFKSEYSADGVTWLQISTTRTITMGSTIYVGLAVSSHALNVLNTSTFDNVSMSSFPIVTPTVAALAYTENAGAVLLDPGITASDVDSANLASATVTMTTNYVNGQDSLAFVSQNGITGTWTAATGVLALTGSSSVANYQTALRTITYTNTSDSPATLARTVTFVANDGVIDSNTASRSITVTAVNDAPAGASKTVITNEDTGYVFTTGDFGFSDPTDGGVHTLLAVKISTLPAIGSLTLSGVGVTVGQVVSAATISSGLLVFIPAANANGVANASFTFQVRDNGGTANGGVDLDPSADTITVDVTAVNDVPSFTKGADQTVRQDATAQSVVGWAASISAGPANESSQVPDFIVTNNNNALFSTQPTIGATGTLTYTLATGANGVTTITVQIHDDGGIANGGVDTSAAQTFVITVSDGAYISSAGWSSSFAGNRYLDLTFPAYVPAGSLVTGATFRHDYRSATAGDTTCYYFEVYSGATLLATHGSAGAPVSCNSTSSYVSDAIALPEVDTVAEANLLTIRLYVKNSGGRQSAHRTADLGILSSLN